MRGRIFCVGVGPGDPELMTRKAVRLIRENRIIAFPGERPERSAAFRIAAAAVPEMAEKNHVAVSMPMTRDPEVMEEGHRRATTLLERYLDQGENVVYLTLGDPTVYSTFSYLQRLLEEDGYPVELIPGVPSFCAAAARLGIPLAEWDEPIHVIPALHRPEEPLDQPGTYILMKAGRHLAEIRENLRLSGRTAAAVENCGMDGEKTYRRAEDIPDEAGYFSLIIAREGKD